MVRSRLSRIALLMVAALAMLAVAPQGRAEAQTAQRCFVETGFCIEGRIREFWEQNGGLPVFGFPVGPQQIETIEGKQLQVQWFERARFETHGERVLLGLLSNELAAARGWRR